MFRCPKVAALGFCASRSLKGLVASIITLALAYAIRLPAAEPEFMPFAGVKPILEAQGEQLPPELKGADQAAWLAWSRGHDKAIRARLEQGDLDSMVNLLLYGTSFTKQPRIMMESLTQASKAGILRARVDDLAAALRSPGENERLVFLQGLLRRRWLDLENAGGRETGVFLYNNLLRVLEERKTLAERSAKAQGAARSLLFHDRGLSLDTGIFSNFSIEQALRDLATRGLLHEGQITRAAVIGPGLDFIDKNEASAYDYYPPQTLQPFALYDSLVRLGLAKAGALSITVLDISPRVLEHVERARTRASKNLGYLMQLPRDRAGAWSEALTAYWRSFGDQAGINVTAMPLPQVLAGVEARAVRIRPEVVLACRQVDLDIVVERLNLSEPDRFDLIVGTNVFVYYDSFEQSLALENAGSMLTRGGLLLTNDRLATVPGGSMVFAGFTLVPYNSLSPDAHEAVSWYRNR
ncbi:MAG: hypothetical protein JO323_18750 [Acidobacteriia bacterium]|nr:hypothetical protein [Terriglobia bacterium]